jgi:transducin (beta)-like 1
LFYILISTKSEGELKWELRRHTSPIFSVKWNKKGDFLVTGSEDETVIVWDTTTGQFRQHFKFHSGPVIDVDWKDDVTIASSSVDKVVYVCRLGMLQWLRTYSGHEVCLKKAFAEIVITVLIATYFFIG